MNLVRRNEIIFKCVYFSSALSPLERIQPIWIKREEKTEPEMETKRKEKIAHQTTFDWGAHH